MNKRVILVGFTLFAIFFGAGNLIFPPEVGSKSGTAFIFAIIGFIFTGVGLPLLGIMAGAVNKSGYRGAFKEIHPLFSLIFLMAIYLTIGPFFAIPRTATTSYEMALLPYLNTPSNISLLIFTILYFVVTLLLALFPNNLVDKVGKYLTPTMLIIIVVLLILSIANLFGVKTQSIDSSYEQVNPFFKGFTEGYLTMDAIAAIAFSTIVLGNIKSDFPNITEKKLFKLTFKASMVAASLLGIIYFAFSFVGNKYSFSSQELSLIQDENQNMGAIILTGITDQLFGSFGPIVLGGLVTLACLTTSVGLIVAVSNFFHDIFSKIPYKTYVIMFTLISFILSNQGLEAVIKTSIPVLLLLYPIGMSLILIILLTKFINIPTNAVRITTALVVLISLLTVLNTQFGIVEWINILPLAKESMGWFIPMIVTLIISTLIFKQINNTHYFLKDE
ncbi:branched-chain amino acid transport system II carrier protein [Abyssicoccus albus]|uniref:Branched-chain amino acid transport system carrier protein n=1 Tax=Abyssicoccus albus TaxID=1817405 RepID=A0A3N5CJM2_9BACL|nr:branched-chain amino acid transport system II carrier protein [Abyssicoccus albus]RPF57971.1 LIVCS family branched-chain amino acid:cation transporter [Abyssicoccus albus]